MKDVHPSVREIAVLQEATEMILASMDVNTVLHQILLIVRNYFGATTCAVLLVDQATNELVIRAENGLLGQAKKDRFKIGAEGVVGWVAHNKAPLYVPDVTRDQRYILEDARIRSELALPLLVREEVIGVLDVESDKNDAFTDEMIGLLALFAGQAAVALENARLYSTERRRMRQVELINLIARSSTAAGDLGVFLSTFTDLISDTFDGSEVSTLLRDEAGRLVLRSHSGSLYPLADAVEASAQRGVIAQSMSSRACAFVNDIAARPGWPGLVNAAGSELCVPMVSFGEVLGAIVIAHSRTHAFTPEDRSIAQAAADVSATAIKNIQLAEELRKLTNTDSLTSLYNQRYFHAVLAQEIQRSRRYNKRFSVLLFDLHSFRTINERLGFDKGDDILRQVAGVLSSQMRAIDTLCRYAGDRFAMVLPETTAEQVPQIRGKILDLLNNLQVELGAARFPLSAAAAQVHYPQDGTDELALVQALMDRVAAAKRDSSSSASA